MKRFIALVLTALLLGLLGCGSPEFTGAKVFIQQRKYDDAIRLLEIEVKKNPTNEQAWFFLGGLKSDKNDVAGMNYAFDECLKISPRYSNEIQTIRAKFDVKYFLFRTYEKEQPLTSTIGNAMLSVKTELKNIHSGAIQSSSSSELIYSGKAGNVIKIVYREYTNDLARPAFTQDLQYDLNETKIIKFKNTTIEVLRVTNQEITLRVLSSPNLKYKQGQLPENAEIDLL